MKIFIKGVDQNANILGGAFAIKLFGPVTGRRFSLKHFLENHLLFITQTEYVD